MAGRRYDLGSEFRSEVRTAVNAASRIRLEVGLTPGEKELVERAAALAGGSTVGFVRAAALAAAREAVTNPPEPNEDLRAASGRRRRGDGSGKRSRPEEYVQANGMVSREVMDRLAQAKARPEVRRGLETELRNAGIEFKEGDPDFGALCELLIGKWLEAVGFGSDDEG